MEVFLAPKSFAGFGNSALIAVSALMVAGQALVRTGAMEPIGRMFAKLWEDKSVI